MGVANQIQAPGLGGGLKLKFKVSPPPVPHQGRAEKKHTSGSYSSGRARLGDERRKGGAGQAPAKGAGSPSTPPFSRATQPRGATRATSIYVLTEAAAARHRHQTQLRHGGSAPGIEGTRKAGKKEGASDRSATVTATIGRPTGRPTAEAPPKCTDTAFCDENRRYRIFFRLRGAAGAR